MNKITTAAALLIFLAAGCQSGTTTSESTTASPTPDGIQATAGPVSTPISRPDPSAAPSLSPSPSPSVAPTASPSASPAAPTTAPTLYKMNKNYDIVPAVPEAEKKVVLLTFDDGPKEKEQLESMLNTLDKHKAKAIFFVNGYRVKQNPDLLKLIRERGQIIGNHSWDHIDLKKETNDKVDQQIGDVQMIVKELTGEAPRFFRPPFGSGNDHVRAQAKAEGMLYMTWSNGSLDWDTKTNNKPQEVIDNVMKQLHAGSNILMHELPWTAETLDNLLTQLEDKGYGFVDPNTIDTTTAE